MAREGRKLGEKPKGRVIFCYFSKVWRFVSIHKRRKALEIIKSGLEYGAEALDICSGAEM